VPGVFAKGDFIAVASNYTHCGDCVKYRIEPERVFGVGRQTDINKEKNRQDDRDEKVQDGDGSASTMGECLVHVMKALI
jgi:hypothetical protein